MNSKNYKIWHIIIISCVEAMNFFFEKDPVKFYRMLVKNPRIRVEDP